MPKNHEQPGARGADMFLLRFPEGMRERLAKAAAKNNRTLTAEVITRLERTLLKEEMLRRHSLGQKALIKTLSQGLEPVMDRFGKIEDRLDKLQRRLEDEKAGEAEQDPTTG
jgi:Arc-like DNA binding domain